MILSVFLFYTFSVSIIIVTASYQSEEFAIRVMSPNGKILNNLM